ncbi:MAG: VPLPA-CTERM sorting domain-containing protein [Roseobacter sp.]
MDSNTFGMVAVLLKSGPQFAAYRFDSGLSGDLDFETANNKGLSNWIAFGRDTSSTGPGPLSSVPLPAAGWMLMVGFGGMVAMRRRKKS